MKIRCNVFVCMMLIIICGCSCVLSDIKSLENNEFISEATFLAITNGAHFAEVKKTLGSAARHELTIADTNASYIMIGTYVDVGDGTGSSYMSLLFRDNVLIKVPQPGKRDIMEIVVKYWDVEDMTYVYKSLAAPSLTREQIQAKFDSLRKINRTYKEDWNVLPAVLLVAPFYIPRIPIILSRIKRDYETNKELRQRFDGCRANIGMTIKDVDALYGTPLRVFSTKDGRPVRIYGDTRYLEIDPQYEFSCVAVLFDAQGRVTNIYSDGFVNEEWITGKTRQNADRIE